MSLYWPDLLREIRYFWGGGTTYDCSGLSLGTTALLVLVSWACGFVTGGLLAILIFSQNCRRVLLFLFQSGAQLLAPTVTGDLGSRAVELRARLRQYRSGE